jgi:hypothetical protein
MVSASRRNHRLGHVDRHRLFQDFGSGFAYRPHEVALRHDARDLAGISLDDDAANVMLLEQFCDIEQRLVCRRGDNIPTLHFQNCRDVHLVSSSVLNQPSS